jgi:phosphate transport system substrate-binding protein
MVGLRKVTGIVAAGLALTLVAAACGSDDGTSPVGGSGQTGMTGSINISGSSTVEPISVAVAEFFNEANPDVAIRVDGPGTGDGFELFCNGETDISDASRPIEADEKEACQKGGVRFIELEVAFDGIAVLTNPANDDVTCLNSGDLYALFGPESEGFDTWGAANGLASEVGGTDGFADAPLEITAPGEESGTYDAFIELSGIPELALERGLSEPDSEALRKDYQASPNDNVIIQQIEGSESALGFVGFAFAEQAADQIKELQIDGGSGCVDPSAETIADGSYPLSRSLYIYVNQEKLAASPALQAYVDFYLSDDVIGEGGAVTQVGYIALPAKRAEAVRSAWSGATA